MLDLRNAVTELSKIFIFLDQITFPLIFAIAVFFHTVFLHFDCWEISMYYTWLKWTCRENLHFT